MLNFASPWNYVYKAEILENDPRWYKKNVMGSGPFTFVEYVPGSHWVGKKYPDYFVKDRPYLDGFRAIFMRDATAQVAAVRGGRARRTSWARRRRGMSRLVRAMGPRITVQESPWVCVLYVAINNEKRPFDDVRVRRALNLAIDRWEAARVLNDFTESARVARRSPPGGPFAMPRVGAGEAARLGAGREKSRAARRSRLLQRGGGGGRHAFALKNRDVRAP